VIGHPAYEPEDRAFDEQRGDQLDERELAMLGSRRLLVVDQAPEEIEDLL